MSHLGDLLSALVDGELNGTDLDRANSHMAACGDCRVEANALRRLKHELRSLAAEVNDSDDFTRRLLALASQTDQPGRADHAGRADQVYQDVPVSAVPVRYLKRSPRPASRRPVRRRRSRYVIWSTVSLVVVGIGTAAFGMGGSPSSQGPQITPQLEVYDAQHAVTSGDVPFVKPTDVSPQIPVGAATP